MMAQLRLGHWGEKEMEIFHVEAFAMEREGENLLAKMRVYFRFIIRYKMCVLYERVVHLHVQSVRYSESVR